MDVQFHQQIVAAQQAVPAPAVQIQQQVHQQAIQVQQQIAAAQQAVDQALAQRDLRRTVQPVMHPRFNTTFDRCNVNRQVNRI